MNYFEVLSKEEVGENHNVDPKTGKKFGGNAPHFLRVGYSGEENEPEAWYAGYFFYDSVLYAEYGATPEEALKQLHRSLTPNEQSL